jgi:hypothetical protein
VRRFKRSNILSMPFNKRHAAWSVAPQRLLLSNCVPGGYSAAGWTRPGGTAAAGTDARGGAVSNGGNLTIYGCTYATNPAPIAFTDTNASRYPQRYYRALSSP